MNIEESEKEIEEIINTQNQQAGGISFKIRTYEYSKPYERKAFSDEVYWTEKNQDFNSTEDIIGLLDQPEKLLLVERSNSEADGLIIQKNSSIYFHNIAQPEKSTYLVRLGDHVKLEVLRGVKNSFYYAVSDDEASVSLNVLQIDTNASNQIVKNE